MKLTFVTVSVTAVKRLIEAEGALRGEYPGALELAVYYAVDELNTEKRERMIRDLATADLAFVDLMGAAPSVRRAVDEGLSYCLGHIVPYGSGAKEALRLGSFTAETLDRMSAGKKSRMKSVSERMSGTDGLSAETAHDMRNYSYMLRYFKVGDKESVENLLRCLLAEYGGLKKYGRTGVKRMLELMSGSGFLITLDGVYPVLKLTPRAVSLEAGLRTEDRYPSLLSGSAPAHVRQSQAYSDP